MDFKFDENLPAEAAGLFREAGHDASRVLDQNLKGCGDGALADVCTTEGRTLITLDVDLADITAHPPNARPGLSYFALSGRTY
jgi:predicted nuclease of predicted toxin-antitoxin system